jgi:hypothetical protein
LEKILPKIMVNMGLSKNIQQYNVCPEIKVSAVLVFGGLARIFMEGS